MNKIKYVIWDFNGTILDDLDLCVSILNSMLMKQNKPLISKNEYLDIFGFPIQTYYEKAGLSFESDSFEDLSFDFIVKYQPKSMFEQLHEGVIETLIALQNRGIKSIILSASETNNLIEQIEHFGLTQYFDYIVGTDNVKALGKVQAGLKLMKTLNEDKSAFLYIGDTIHDCEVAKALDVNIVLYTKGHQSESRLRDKTNQVIHKIYDIIKYID